MIDGKRNLSERLLQNILKNIQKKTKKNYLIVFKLALKNILLPISTVKVKKRKFQRTIPFFIVKEKRILKTIKYLGFLNKSNKQKFIQNEIINLSNNKGIIKNYLKTLNHQGFLNKTYITIN